MLLRTTLLLFIVVLVIKVQGQQIPQTFQGKTHMLSEQELLRLNEVGKAFEATLPPVGNVRSIAEFERTEGIIVAFLSFNSGGGYFGIPIDLIAEISEDALVYTVVEDSSAMDFVTDLYNANGVLMENIIYVFAEANSYWSRDYSPWFIAQNDTVSIVDFPYNRPRPDDDEMPIVFGDFFDMEIYGMDLISTGGNYMSDGRGVAASCDLVNTENPDLSREEVHAFANQYLGITKYHLLDDPLDDYIEHIDCWGKFLDVDKILIGEVPETDYRYADFELLAYYWGNQTSSYGNKYKVFRTFSPNGQPYTNSLILNNKVLVPIVTGYGSDYNDAALEVYRNAMPGYEVIGITHNPIYAWQSTDALHCRTHEVPDREMLYINHVPLMDSLPTEDSIVNIVTNVSSYGKHEITSVALNYTINDSVFPPIHFNLDSAAWYSCILDAAPGDTIQYYISAQDSTGKEEAHPFMGALDPNAFFITGYPIDTAVIDTTVNDTSTTNINSITQHSFELKLYPNPTSGKVSLALIDFPYKEATIRIKDINGRIVTDKHYYDLNEWFRTNFDLSHLNSGVYFLELTSGEIRETKKIIVY